MKHAVAACESCEFVMFRDVCGVRLKESHLEALLIQGRTAKIKGFVSKDKTFASHLELQEEEGTYKVVFARPEGIPCLACEGLVRRSLAVTPVTLWSGARSRARP